MTGLSTPPLPTGAHVTAGAKLRVGNTADRFAPQTALAAIRALVELTKPRILAMCLVAAAAGMVLAPGAHSASKHIFSLIGIAMAVAAANALNMYLERDVDRQMVRTQDRPLPAGRLRPGMALTFGCVLAVASIAGLWLWTNPLTALLGALAIDSYVLLYTPLKRRTHWALYVGAVPGAMPPLMGWTSITQSLDPAGLLLFAVLFFWQIPHFIAIALYRKADYARAKIRVLPLVRGDRAAKWVALAHTCSLIAATLLLMAAAHGLGWPYGVAAAVLGAGLLVLAVRQLRSDEIAVARQFFFGTLIHLPLLVLALIVNAIWHQ